MNDDQFLILLTLNPRLGIKAPTYLVLHIVYTREHKRIGKVGTNENRQARELGDPVPSAASFFTVRS